MIGDRKIVFNSLTKFGAVFLNGLRLPCLLYTSDAADD